MSLSKRNYTMINRRYYGLITGLPRKFGVKAVVKEAVKRGSYPLLRAAVVAVLRLSSHLIS